MTIDGQDGNCFYGQSEISNSLTQPLSKLLELCSPMGVTGSELHSVASGVRKVIVSQPTIQWKLEVRAKVPAKDSQLLCWEGEPIDAMMSQTSDWGNTSELE